MLQEYACPIIGGKSAALRKDGHVPNYRFCPGEYLVMRVVVTVTDDLWS